MGEDMNVNKLTPQEIEYKIEIATQTLDRNIGFISNCDTKTSIVLTVVGVLFTLILSDDGISEISNIFSACLNTITLFNILFLFSFIGSVGTMMIGMYKLGSVLIAKTSDKSSGDNTFKSLIFFSGIQKSGDRETYRDQFYSMSREELLNELLDEIYANADIATQKYTKYNSGLKYATIGFILFLILFLLGIYLY